MPAPHKKTVYKPLPISNPFQEGQDRAYSDILLDKMKETQFWRRSSFVIVGLFLISVILNMCSLSQQKTVPVLVNVMPSGESQYLGEVRSGSMQVPEAAIHYQIRTFIINLRSVSTDYQVVYQNIDDCFIMVTQNYSPLLRQHIINDSPFIQVGKIRRTVEIESILHITGRSYNVNWSETTFDATANQHVSKMRAVVTVNLFTPTDATIKRNPLGIYIENFEMTEL